MRVRGLVAKIAMLLGVLTLAVSSAVADPPAGRVTSVRFGGEGTATRIVIETDAALQYHVFLLATGSNRVVIDLPRVRWSINGLTTESGSGAGMGVVAGYRYAHNTASTSRLVLDLAQPATVAREFVLAGKDKDEPHRIVIDLDPTTSQAFSAAATGDMGGPQPVAQQVSRKPLIVIDPGHGGKDPGALSRGGVKEKDITLAVAAQLRDMLLETQRYDVALTRSTDVFIELEDRVTKARNLGADLFIALHADAGGKPATRGASVYTLSPDGEKRIDSASRQHDWILDVEVDSTRPDEVNQILRDLVQRETKNQSARFAQILTDALTASGWPTLENTHRRKSLYVLLSPDTPAALLEMGFLTNDDDVTALKSETRRQKLVKSVTQAIDHYFDAQTMMVAGR
jgi:N-acetylmuramoyl-L-alanine amidase